LRRSDVSDRGAINSPSLPIPLAEFPSAVEAVRAAVLFQTRTQELTIGDVEDRRIAFRVGINIGDVIVEAHDIFGDGVNIAARLESIAEPGGVLRAPNLQVISPTF